MYLTHTRSRLHDRQTRKLPTSPNNRRKKAFLQLLLLIENCRPDSCARLDAPSHPVKKGGAVTRAARRLVAVRDLSLASTLGLRKSDPATRRNFWIGNTQKPRTGITLCDAFSVAISAGLPRRQQTVGHLRRRRGSKPSTVAEASGVRQGCKEKRRFPFRKPPFTTTGADRRWPLRNTVVPLSSCLCIASSSGSLVARRLPGRHSRQSAALPDWSCCGAQRLGKTATLRWSFCTQAHTVELMWTPMSRVGTRG